MQVYCGNGRKFVKAQEIKSLIISPPKDSHMQYFIANMSTSDIFHSYGTKKS